MVILSAFVLAIQTFSSEASSSWYTTKQELLKDYDAMMPPPNMRNPDPLKVGMGLSFKSMSYDVITGFLELECWFRMEWYDERLAYEGSKVFGESFDKTKDYISLDLMNGDSKALWTPDLQAYNATHFNEGISNELRTASLYPNEVWTKERPFNVFLSRPGTLRTYCKPNLVDFPFDIQPCKIHFASWAFSQDFLIVETRPHLQQKLKSACQLTSNEYTVMDVQQGAPPAAIGYEAVPAKWSGVDVTVVLKRLPTYYLLNAILPMLIIVALSTFTFWIPVNPDHTGSGERLTFSITCLLTIVAVELFTCQSRPMIGQETWLDVWIVACLFCTLIPILETVLVIYIDGLYQNSSSVPARDTEEQAKFTQIVKKGTTQELIQENRRRDKELALQTIKWQKNCAAGCGRYCQWANPVVMGPRSVDLAFRHGYPLFVVIIFAISWARVPQDMLPWHNWSFCMLFFTIMGIFILMFLFAIPALQRRYVFLRQKCTGDDSDDSDLETPADDGDEHSRPMLGQTSRGSTKPPATSMLAFPAFAPATSPATSGPAFLPPRVLSRQ